MADSKDKMHFLTQRQKFDTLEAQMRQERDTFKTYWRDLSKYILPRRSRFFTSDVNKGERRNTDIIDPTGTMAARTLSSGMMTGVTSPARPWFRLTTDDDELNQSEAVKTYLKQVESKMRAIFLKSNLYNVLPVLYGDLGTFGTACIFMEEDFEDSVYFHCFPIGSYMISNDKKGRARVFFREFQMTVRQVVEKFGRIEGTDKINWDNISQSVKDQYDKDQMETYVDVAHIILPNEMYKPNRPESKFKKYKSVYYERGLAGTSNHTMLAGVSNDRFLSEKGYDYFPVMAVRWELAGEDTYGTNAPGMVCLGDVKQLQLGEKRAASAIDQKVKPSMIGPTSLKNVKASILPGDITYLDEREGQRGFRRLFEIDFDIRELEGKQEQVRQRVSKAFYEDLFLMLANTNRRNITATEIEERVEEKLLALGPVLERLNQDLLDPLIENTYLILSRQNMLPDTPEELQDQDYRIEYISVMAQAQKLAGIGNIERLMGYVGQVAGLDPNAVNKVDVEESIELYADLVGVPPKLVKSQEEMEALREEQALMAQQEQEAMEAAQAVEAGKTLADTKITEDSALNQLLQGEI